MLNVGDEGGMGDLGRLVSDQANQWPPCQQPWGLLKGEREECRAGGSGFIKSLPSQLLQL